MPGPRATVTLAKNLERALRQGHPWVFRDALVGSPALADGTLVELHSRDGRPVAVGYWDAASAIAVRVLEPGPLPDPAAALRERLGAALKRRLARLDLRRTNAFRWLHGEGDRLAGIHVDLYDDVAVVRFDGSGARAYYRDIGPALSESSAPLKLRSVVDRQSGDLLFGAKPPAAKIVVENGLRFEVSPGIGGKGGLYLDQRENREVVEAKADGRSVLNLFGYTGAFSLYAARGGATSTDTVDIAKPAIAMARRNFELNGLSTATAGFHAVDAFEFLESAVQRRRSWDLVISDPPSFAPTKRALEKARRAYRRLHRLAAEATSPAGLLLAASCSSHLGRDEFHKLVEAGVRDAGSRFEVEERRGAGFDHPALSGFPEGDYLKVAIGRVSRTRR